MRGVDGENVRAADSICVEAGGRGFNMLRAAWTEDLLSLCSRLGSTSLQPRRRWRKNKLKIGWLCFLTNYLICITLCGFHLKGILTLTAFAVIPKKTKKKKHIIWRTRTNPVIKNYSEMSQITIAINLQYTRLFGEITRLLLDVAVCCSLNTSLLMMRWLKSSGVFLKSGSAQRCRFIDMAGDIKSVIFIMFYRG